MRAIATALCLAFVACGRQAPEEVPTITVQKKETKVERPQPLYVDGREQLPNCTWDQESRVAYLFDEKLFLSCHNLEWLEVEVKAAATPSPAPTARPKATKEPETAKATASATAAPESEPEGSSGCTIVKTKEATVITCHE